MDQPDAVAPMAQPRATLEGRRDDRRLDGRCTLVVGDGTAADPDPPGNGQAISVLAAREGSTVVVADID